MAPHLYLQNNYDAWRDFSYCLSVFFMSAYNVPIFNLRLRGTGKTNGNLKQLMTGIPLGINLVARRSACIDLGYVLENKQKAAKYLPKSGCFYIVSTLGCSLILIETA